MNHSDPENSKKRFSRGRRPGVPLNKYPKDKANPNDRPGLQRFSVSLPAALARVVRGLKGEVDLEYSKIFRKGMDLFVRMSYEKGEISKKTYDRYWAERRVFRDEDMI